MIQLFYSDDGGAKHNIETSIDEDGNVYTMQYDNGNVVK
jgi:hypothetical protein